MVESSRKYDIYLFEPTNVCNLRCPLCPTGNRSMKRKRGFMNPKRFAEAFDKENIRGLQVWLWGWGEPLLHPQLYELVAIAKTYKNFVEVQSNGYAPIPAYQKLLRENPNVLTISLDGFSDRTMRPLRGNTAAIRQVKNLLQTLCRLRCETGSSTLVNVQCLATRFNEQEIERIRDWALNVAGVDRFSLKTICLGEIDQEKAARFLPLNPQLSRYERDPEGNASLPPRNLNGCYFLEHVRIVLWNFTVVPCCYDHSGEYAFGNLLTDCLENKPLSLSAKAFHNAFARKKISLCNLCLEQREKTLFVERGTESSHA